MNLLNVNIDDPKSIAGALQAMQTPAVPETPEHEDGFIDNSAYKNFLLNHFEPEDCICFMFLAKDAPPQHVFIKQCDALKADFFINLQEQNETANVYVGMNAYSDKLVGRSIGRTADNVSRIRNLYADADHDAAQSRKLIAASSEVPSNPTILQSSPGKYQFIWRVDDIPKEEAKAVLKAIASEFRTDPAVAEVARVLRVPGFKNHKYPELPVVKTVQVSGNKFSRADFKLTVQEQKTVHETARELIPHGMIHPWMLRKAGELRNKGLNEEELTPVLLRLVHENCEPPIDDLKVKTMAKSVCRYARGSDFPVILGGKALGTCPDTSPADWRSQFRNLSEMEQGDIVMIIDGVLQEGTCFIGADPGHGKTLVALAFAKAIALGEPLFGISEHTVKQPRNVVYLIPESGDRAFRHRGESFRLPQDDRMAQFALRCPRNRVSLSAEHDGFGVVSESLAPYFNECLFKGHQDFIPRSF